MKSLIETLLRWPLAFLFGLVGVTGFAVFLVLSSFQIESDIAEAIKGQSPAYENYLAFETRFGAPSKDEVFMVQAPDLGADGTFAALESLVIELSLTEGVLGVMSLFSLPDPDGQALNFLTRPALAGLTDAQRLDRAYVETPFARQLMSEDRTTTLISLIPDLSIAPAARQDLLGVALGYGDPGLTVTPIGLTAVQRTIAVGLMQDLMFLTPMIILICLVVSLALFRSWRAAVICTVPAVLGLVWTFGAMAALGIAFTAILAIAPAVLIVLGIADSIHIFNAVAQRRASAPLAEAIADGVIETLPAIILATLTTVFAFASLRVVGSPTMSDLAVVGSLGLGLTLVAVVMTVPLFSRLLLSETTQVRPLVAFAGVSRFAVGLLDHRRLVAVGTLLILVALFATQTRTIAGFNVTDHVPHRSGMRTALDELNRALPGSDQLYVVVEDVDGTPTDTDADQARLRAASAVLYGDPRAMPEISQDVPLDNASVRRFRGDDHTGFALPVASRLSDNWTDTLARAEGIEAELAAAGLGEVSTVTGYMLMASVEIPGLVWELRRAFYLAVGAVTILAAVLLRSIPLALIAVAPNLIPILGIEAWLVVRGLPLTLTGAIGLTIAFGIAVDNTIHILNRLRLLRAGLSHLTRAEIAMAISTTAPAIVTSTLILITGLGMTVFSTLPSVALFGQLVSGAMALAMGAALFLFPGLLAWRENSEDTS